MIHTSRDDFSPALIAPGGACALRGGRFLHGPQTLADVLRRAGTHGEAAMTVVEGRRHSYRQALEEAAALARTLSHTAGVAQGDLVALALGNGLAWMTAFLAVASLGAVPVLVNSRGAPDELRHAIESLGCRAVLADAERAALLAQAWEGLPLPMITAVADSWAQVLAHDAGGPLAVADTDPSDLGAVLFTSGTTGRPKGALLSQGALAQGIGMGELLGAMNDACREAESGAVQAGRSIHSPTIIGGPLFHLGGVNPFLRCLWSGVTTHLNGRWNAEMILDMIAREGVSRIAMVPTMYWDLLRAERAGQGALARVKVISSGAAPILPDLVASLVAAIPGVLLSNTYGSTETSGYVASIMGREFLAHQDACGHILPTTEARLITDDGCDAETGEAGEICVRGPCVMDGYLGDDTGGAFLSDTAGGPWFRTGDVGVMDAGGRLRIVDRKKNMIISGGENIYCAEVERVLSEHPDVREVLAFGLPDPRLGERLAVAVLPRPGSALSDGDVKDQAASRLARYKVPRDVILATEALPRTASGKIDRGAVIQWAKGRI
jgi:acyl-CoA synthetase (AMP-forming)/AMP-acid ligase II